MFLHHVTLQATNFPAVLFQKTHPLSRILNLLCKKNLMLHDKCKWKIGFLFISDLLGLTVSSSKRLVGTCKDHPKSPTNSNFSGIGFFFSLLLKKQNKQKLENSFKYDTYISQPSKGLENSTRGSTRSLHWMTLFIKQQSCFSFTTGLSNFAFVHTFNVYAKGLKTDTWNTERLFVCVHDVFCVHAYFPLSDGRWRGIRESNNE